VRLECGAYSIAETLSGFGVGIEFSFSRISFFQASKDGRQMYVSTLHM